MRAPRYARVVMRRGVILGLALIALSLAMQSSGPVSFTTSKKVRPLIEGARLTRTLIFDGGALRLDPPVGGPGMSEARALTLWQSQGFGGYQVVVDPEVFLAQATVRVLPKRNPTAFAAPRLVRRLAWVFISRWGAHGCPARMGPSFSETHPVPEPTDVEMIAADTSSEGVSYRTSGASCGYPSKPSSQAATYALSVPWTILSAGPAKCPYGGHGPCGSSKNARVRITLPECARQSGGSSGGSLHGATSLSIFVEVPLTGQPCSHEKTEVVETPILGSPTSETIGLVRAIRTSSSSLTYFDGSMHTLTFNS